jgi:hypothetical protein
MSDRVDTVQEIKIDEYVNTTEFSHVDYEKYVKNIIGSV